MDIIAYCGICGTRNVTQEGNAAGVIHCTKCGVRIPVQSFGIKIPQIRLFCPSCQIKLCASPEQGGDRLHCPKCHEWVRLAPVEQTPEDVEAAKKRKPWVWS
ncbi:MAG: hypothetical protein GXP25_00260 [Planctomycetes bacterium]|nr:hypothetical protein [Planctomycetota bacterium]